RCLTSLLLISSSFNQIDNDGIPFHISRIDEMKDNFVIIWKNVHISSLMDEFIDLILPYLSQYLELTTSSPKLGRECLSGIVLLADKFVPNQRTIIYPLLLKCFESQYEI